MNIKHPTLLLDTLRCKENISFMKKKAEINGLNWKPHFKTHQSKEVGEWFRNAGVTGITVSSIAMAEYFASSGWEDITIAFPANVLAAEELNSLGKRINLTLLADNKETIAMLDQKIVVDIDILVEVDAGSNRTGIKAENYHSIKETVMVIKAAEKLNFRGFYSHFGHTYKCRGEEEIKRVFGASRNRIVKMMKDSGYDDMELHIGDTPGCTVAEDFSGITTITPGNFIFYDVMQQNIGSCSYDQVAVVMACPVVSKNEERNEVCVHGGAVHFSKDNISAGDRIIFGKIVEFSSKGIEKVLDEAMVVTLSQEHGIIEMTEEQFHKVHVGDVIGILPVHSCLTAECMGSYQDFSGKSIDHL